jgi:hypothetical protein
MAALIDATTGYDTVADFGDTTPQPDSVSSGAGLTTTQSFVSFLWPSFVLIEGRYLEIVGDSAKEVWGIVGV